LYELVFPIGLVGAALLGSWVVPNLGWHYMFLVGAAPAILALFMLRLLPESPRWLAVRGRDNEAEASMSYIERETEKSSGKPLPPTQTCCHHASTTSFLVRPSVRSISDARWLSG
jgi:putative MFS transporter